MWQSWIGMPWNVQQKRLWSQCGHMGIGSVGVITSFLNNPVCGQRPTQSDWKYNQCQDQPGQRRRSQAAQVDRNMSEP